MKLNGVRALVAVGLMGVLFSCDREPIAPSMGEIKFSVSAENDFNAGRSNPGTPSQIIFSYTKLREGNKSEFITLKVLSFNNQYVSEPYYLAPGEYSLASFFVTDMENNVLYAAPLKNSEMAKYVTKPLPMTFQVTQEAITDISLEVIKVEDDTAPEKFGYAKFGLSIIGTFPLRVAVMRERNLIGGELTIHGLNTSGEVKWSKHQALTNSENVITVRGNLHSYRIIAHARGVTKVFHFSEIEIRELKTFVIELTDADYHKYSSNDNMVTLFLPKDPTDPYMELRIDKSLSRIYYGYVDRAFYLNGKPASDMVVRQISEEERGVIIDETSFAQVSRFKGGYGDTWDEADAMLICDTSAGIYSFHHIWEVVQ